MREPMNRWICLLLMVVMVLGAPAVVSTETRRHEPFFRSSGPESVLTGGNGFRVKTSSGRFETGDFQVRGVEAAVESPWGETMRVRFWMDQEILVAEINDRLMVLTTYDRRGRLLDMAVENDGQLTRTRIGNRAERFARKGTLPRHLDVAAYEALWDGLRKDHSEAFLDGLGRFESDTAAPTACTLEAIGCGAAAASWILSIGGILSGCTVAAGMPLLTPVCLAAILGHELANVGLITSCGSLAECRSEPPDAEPRDPCADNDNHE